MGKLTGAYYACSLGVKFLILAGCITDQCVESAVRDACDKHYFVTLVTGMVLSVRVGCAMCLTEIYPVGHFQAGYGCVCADACATFSQERHDNSLRTINGFCRQRTVQQLSDELDSLR